MNTEQTNEPTEHISNHRRKGNIAKLPKALRDKINTMLDDGIDYPVIIQALGDDGKHLQPSNFTHWKNGGYQDYLRNQNWRERIDAKADRYLDVGINDGAKLAAGGLYAAAIQICEIMDELAAATPGETDADKCARMTNTLSRLSRSMLMLQQHREALERQRAADPSSPEQREKARTEFLDSMDQLFGIRPRKRPAPNEQNEPTAPATEPALVGIREQP